MISNIYKEFMLEQKFRNNTGKTIEWYQDNLEKFFIWLDTDNPANLSQKYIIVNSKSLMTKKSKPCSAALETAKRIPATSVLSHICLTAGCVEVNSPK